MRSLLIVDDDLLVRTDIRLMMDWNGLGIGEVREAANGVEAVERISSSSPDIIILDIEMPLMDGLEVISWIQENGFAGKIIVLSCHDEFEKVKMAMKMGAFDYMLKHLLRSEDLAAATRSAMAAIESGEAEKEQLIRMKELSEQGATALKDRLVRELVGGIFPDREQADEAMERLGIRFGWSNYAIIAVKAESERSEEESGPGRPRGLRFKEVGNLIERTVRHKPYCLWGHVDDFHYAIVLDFDATRGFMAAMSESYEIGNRILYQAKQALNVDVSIGISKCFTGYSALSDCYRQSQAALAAKFYTGKNSIFHISEVERYKNKPDDRFRAHETAIREAMRLGRPDVLECLKHVFADLKNRNIEIEYMKFLGLECLSWIVRLAEQYGIRLKDVPGFDYMPYEQAIRLETLRDIERWVTKLCLDIHDRIERKRAGLPKDMRPEIKRALRYIELHYKKEISLQEIADYAELSRTYFSQLFKQEAGINFIDYLNQFRVEKAKKLLDEGNLKIYEVGAECGFENYYYFAKMFRKVAGVSPREFRRH